MDMNRFNAHLSSPQTIADAMTSFMRHSRLLHKMKRLDCCCTDPPPKRRAAAVHLNVGGKSFDTTHDTLAKASYFLPYLEGQFIAMYHHTTTTTFPHLIPHLFPRPTGAFRRRSGAAIHRQGSATLRSRIAVHESLHYSAAEPYQSKQRKSPGGVSLLWC